MTSSKTDKKPSGCVRGLIILVQLALVGVLFAIIGVIGIVAGVLAIAWPDITIWVLGLVIGIRLLFFGLLEVYVANQLRQLTA